MERAPRRRHARTRRPPASGGGRPIAAGGSLSILQGGCGPVIANGPVTIRQGGCGPLIANGDVSIEQGGSQSVIAAGGATLGDRSFVGLVLSPKVTVEDGAKILMNTPQALAFGATRSACWSASPSGCSAAESYVLISSARRCASTVSIATAILGCSSSRRLKSGRPITSARIGVVVRTASVLGTSSARSTARQKNSPGPSSTVRPGSSTETVLSSSRTCPSPACRARRSPGSPAPRPR